MWESHEQQEEQVTLVSWRGRGMAQVGLLRQLCYTNSSALEATSQDLFQEQALGHTCPSTEGDGDNRLR